MVKRGIFSIVVLAIFITILTSNVNATTSNSICSLEASLINQDPHPGISGDYVEILLQINGVLSNCDNGAFAELILDYPFSLDKNDYTRKIQSSTYSSLSQNSNWNILYNLRIDENAKEGDYEIELRYNEGNSRSKNYNFRKFNISVEDGRTDFEIHVQDFIIAQKDLTFEILNIGNQDIEALTIEIPKQKNIIVKGSNRNIVGDLDSNEFTTANFEATPNEGEIILNLIYTDSTNERRFIEKTVYYDHSYFEDSLNNQKQSQTGIYITIGVIVLLIILFLIRRSKKKKSRKGMKFSI